MHPDNLDGKARVLHFGMIITCTPDCEAGKHYYILYLLKC